MKNPLLKTVLLILFTYLQSTWGYSPIWKVDGWDANRLKEAGITVTTLKNTQIGEVPPMNWVEITYDTSKLKEDQDVVMTLQVIAENGEAISVHRAEHKKGEPGKMKIAFAVRKENIEHSFVHIVAPKLLSKGAGRDLGNPGFAGYLLHLSRIMQLVDDAPKDQSIDK
jgi:hypothetical protein